MTSEIQDSDEKLHRQVHPSFAQGDQVSSQVFTSQVFKPTNKDDGRLSVSAGSFADPHETYSSHTAHGFSSAGVVTVTVAECNDIDLRAYYDPLDGAHKMGPDPAHSVIDMTGVSKSQRSDKATLLKDYALQRGWSYRPPEQP